MSAATFLVGDVFQRMAELPDHSFDLIACSPPFYGLRSYVPDDHPDKPLEIGMEESPAKFIDTLLSLAAEWRRLLTPHGSIAIELGDTYAGSGGAGGDYDENGLRAGQPRFRIDWSRSGVRPLSLCGIPHAFMLSLVYGYNVLDRKGPDSPAGQWLARNYKSWIRSNPPVGALGGKERPATSYITVACVGRDRWFDLDAVRTPLTDSPGNRYARPAGKHDAVHGEGWEAKPTPPRDYSAGAPPLDWNVDADLVIDTEIDRRAGQTAHRRTARGIDQQARTGKSADRDGNWDALPEMHETNGAVGARGVHIRRALTTAGILPGLDAYDISPRGYQGSHYAVFPKELVRRLIDEMCPRRVCTVCGQPSRRVTDPFTLDSYRASGRPQSIKAVALADAAGLTDQHIAAIRAFGTSDAGKALTVNSGAGKNTDKVKHLAREAKAVLGGYFREFVQTTTASRTSTWSDCGCPGDDRWRPGRILDPFVGSGTTLAVATGMARTAVGIDLDETNADLARERVGMFLTVHEREVPDAS